MPTRTLAKMNEVASPGTTTTTTATAAATQETSNVDETETAIAIVAAEQANESENTQTEKKNEQAEACEIEIGIGAVGEGEIKENSKPQSEIETESGCSSKAPEVNLKTQKPSAVDKAKEVDGGDEVAEQDEFAQYAEHVTYTEDGEAIYTDPSTKRNYKWSSTENTWLLVADEPSAAAAASLTENEHFKWCEKTQKWLPKETETEHYKWDAEKEQWEPKDKACGQTVTTGGGGDIAYEIDEEGQRVYTDKDGVVYFWDAEKNAWFPKIDDDFMARYQMNYGFIDNTSASQQAERKREEQEAKRKAEELKRMADEARAAMESATVPSPGTQGNKRKAQEPPKWFDLDPAHNTKVYVWNLPLDITMDEFAELMGKCGMIMRDPQTQKFKLKLYTEADGQIKGDGLCDYIKVESVDLALKILDEYNLRGQKIRVQRAQFQMRGEYNPALKPKKKKKDKEKLQKMKEKLFDWRPDKMRGERTKNEKVVIIKNLFTPELFEKEVQLILDYQNDLREECTKCGQVRKVVIYDRHPEGIAQINMSTPEEADLVIQMMQGRFFGQRQLTAEHWDGKTKYKINETETETQQRLSKWDQFLETEEVAAHAEEKASEKVENATETELITNQ